jgi:hypothetical protein
VCVVVCDAGDCLGMLFRRHCFDFGDCFGVSLHRDRLWRVDLAWHP